VPFVIAQLHGFLHSAQPLNHFGIHLQARHDRPSGSRLTLKEAGPLNRRNLSHM